MTFDSIRKSVDRSHDRSSATSSQPGTYLNLLLGMPSNSVRHSVGSQHPGNYTLERCPKFPQIGVPGDLCKTAGLPPMKHHKIPPFTRCRRWPPSICLPASATHAAAAHGALSEIPLLVLGFQALPVRARPRRGRWTLPKIVVNELPCTLAAGFQITEAPERCRLRPHFGNPRETVAQF